jgi:putative transposase
VRERIERRFAKRLGLSTVRLYLRRWGMTPQKPLLRAKERSPAAIEAWLERDGTTRRSPSARTCRKFRVWAGMMGAKEPRHAATQRTEDPRRPPRPALGRRRPEGGVRPERPARRDELKKALAERALNAEMDHHLAGDNGAGNTRNGYGRKSVLTETGKIELEVPRDRQATFDPQLIAKYQRRFPGFDDKIVSMYARGMSTREIVGHLRELYGIDVSPDLISAVTGAVLEEVAAWQARPLEPVYPLVFLDALRVKVRDEGLVRNKAVHLALGVRADGTKEILGLWLEQNEGAKFWLRVMNELKNRGVEDILIAVVDGLKGFPEAITAVFPDAMVQTCIVHLLRQSRAWPSSPTRTARRSPRG